MKAGAIAGIVIGIVLAIIAIIIVVVISIKKRASKIPVLYSREWIKQQFESPNVNKDDAIDIIDGLYVNNGLEMSKIDDVLAYQAPIKWIDAIKEYNDKIQIEEAALKASNDKGELKFDHIENKDLDGSAYPIYIRTPDQFSAMEYLSSSPHLRDLLQRTTGSGSYSRKVRDDASLDNAVKYYYTYKAFTPTKWPNDPVGEIVIPESSYKRLEDLIGIIDDFKGSNYQTFDEYLSKQLGVPEDEVMNIASYIINLLTINPLNDVEDKVSFIAEWNNMTGDNDIRYNYRLPALYLFDKMAEPLNIQVQENL